MELSGYCAHSCTRRVTHPDVTKREKWSSVLDPSKLCPMCLLIWLVLIYIPYNETPNISIALSWVLCVIIANYWAKGGHRNPCTVASESESECFGKSPGIPGIWSKGCPVGNHSLKVVKSDTKYESLVLELNWNISAVVRMNNICLNKVRDN